VRARVTEPVPTGAQREFFGTASSSPSDELICDAAVILSFDKRPTAVVGPGSGTHQTNIWEFSRRTGVLIEEPHEGLSNAIARRERDAAAKLEA
jgi:hypothetical protein